MQLKSRVTALMVTAVLSIWLVTEGIEWQQDKDRENRYRHVLLQSQSIAWNKLQSESMADLHSAISDVLSHPNIEKAWAKQDFQALESIVQPILEKHSGWRADWFDSRRALVRSSSIALNQQPLIDNGWLARALSADTTQLGFSQPSRESYYVVALRRFGPKDAPGVLVIGQELAHLLPDLSRTISGESFLINLRGREVAGTLPGLASQERLAVAVRRPRVAETGTPGGRHWLTAALPLSGPNDRPIGTVLTAWDITRQVESDAQMELVSRSVALAMLAALGWAIFAYLRHALRPLARSVQVLDRLASGDLRAAPDEDDQALPDEAGQIARSVAALRNEMLNLQMLRDERVRIHQQQERLIRRQMRQLADTLDDSARSEVLVALEPPEHAQTQGENSLVQLAGILGRMSDLVTTQQHRLVSLLNKLREAMAHQATLISLQQELEIARTMQLSILPRSAPATDAVSVSAIMIPAKEVGGDFYDYFLMEDGRLALVVADVSGKGIPAAFFMAVSRTLLKNIAQFLREPADIIDRLNKQLCSENEQMMFVSVFLGLLDLRTGQLDYVNAGHNPPLLMGADGTITMMPRGQNIALAVSDEVGFTQGQLQMQQGDTLLLYTDGVTEAVNPEGQFFSENRLIQWASQAGASSDDLPEVLLDQIRQFEAGADQADDITCVAARFLG